MIFDQICSDVDALFRRNIRKSDEARVWKTVQMDELPEVRVDCDENPAFGFGPVQSARSPGSGPSSRASITS